jgi:hypothetical protein
MTETKEPIEKTISKYVAVARVLDELRENGVLSINNKCVHLTPQTFSNYFGTKDVKRTFKPPDNIRCSVIREDVEFAAWFDVPHGVKIVTFEKDTETYVNLEDVELKP